MSKPQRDVVRKVRLLHRQGVPLNITAVKRNHPELIERVYSIKPFWGWRRALNTAGIDYAHIRVRLEETVVCLLCGRGFRNLGSHLRAIHETTVDEYRDEFPDAEVMCEAMRADLRFSQYSKIKLRMPHWEPIWSAEYILDRISVHEERGHPLNCRALAGKEGSIIWAARKYFGDWDKALRRVGLNPQQIRLVIPKRSWTPEMVTAELRRRAEQGLPMNVAAVMRGDSKLSSAASRAFGSYSKALRRAGLDLADVMKRPPPYTEVDRQRLLRAVRHAANKQGVARERAVERLRKKYRGVADRFYNKAWRKIARDAGVAPNEIRRWRKKRFPTKQEVVEALRNRLRREEQVTAVVVLREDPHLHKAVVHHFGSFYACYGSIGLRRKDIPTRLKYRARSDVVAEIRRRHHSGQRLNASTVEHGQDRDWALVDRARKLFRSWDQALKATGLKPQKIRLHRPGHRYESPTAVVAEIKRRRRENLPLHWSGVARGTHHDRGLQRRAILFFGSWDKALEAAGLSPERIRRRPRSKHPNRCSIGVMTKRVRFP